jgi:GT2 family glycosyltransferase
MNSTSSPLVSVISVAYKRRDNVLKLMEALRQQDYTNFEVIVVDNDSQDGTAEAIEALYPEVKVLRSPQNFGMVAYNFGLANAKGKYILVIDDDGLPASFDWISQVVNCFEANPRLGAVACTIRMCDTGRLGYDSPQFVLNGDLTHGYQTVAYNGTGAGLRATALHQVGHYPFHFFRSWLELHLCTRLIEAGWEVRYFPSIEVWHSRPSGSINRPVTYYGLRNYLWYVWTFYPWPQVAGETIHVLGSRLKLTLTRRMPLGTFMKALMDGVLGWLCQPSTRQPISHETLTYLRRVREYSNDQGVVPAHRPYPVNDQYVLTGS